MTELNKDIPIYIYMHDLMPKTLRSEAREYIGYIVKLWINDITVVPYTWLLMDSFPDRSSIIGYTGYMWIQLVSL